jgi:predicted transcriptional regulator
MFNSDFYNLTQEAQGAIFQAGYKLNAAAAAPASPNPLLQVRRGLAESPGWLFIQAAEFDPEPLSVEKLRVRAVWSSPRIVQALLEMMAGEKWFDRVGDNYYLTDEGRDVMQAITERRRKLVHAAIPAASADATERLEVLLRRVIDASLSAAQPPDIWSLVHSRHRAPRDDVPVLEKIFQYFSDINAYRDDSHMAAFQPHQIEAYVWEAFSLVWSESANTAQAIYEQLFYRGYSRIEYASALDELVVRGWVENSGDSEYHLTTQGRAIRDEAERLTDEYFYAPWKILSEAEAQETQTLLLEMRDRLNAVGA